MGRSCIALNPEFNCLLIPTGLGSVNSTLQFWVSDFTTHSSFSIAHYASNQIEVPVRRGDDALMELGIDRLDGLVLDMEGWEVEALRGLQLTLARHPLRWAIIECTDWALNNAGTSVEELRDMISSLSLRVVQELGNDLICVRR